MPLIRGKKALAGALLHRTGLASLMARRRRGSLLVFNYHRIRPNGPLETPFDEEVYGPSVSELEAQIGWLAARFRILSEADLVESITCGADVREPAAMITFDDGYKDNFTRARPVLTRHGVPAVFFVPSRLVEERQLGWWDQIAYLVKRTSRLTAELGGRGLDLRNKPATIRDLFSVMKLRPEQETHDLVGRLAVALDVPLPSDSEQDDEIMTWSDLRACADDGIAIGSHSHSHRVLATLTAAEQRVELTLSRELIAKRLGREVRSVAYPVGGREHFTATTMQLAAETGFDLAFSFRGPGCINRWGRIHPFDVRRLAVPSSLPLAAATAALPEVFADQ